MARELTHHFRTLGGLPVWVRLCDPDHESIAAFFGCQPDDLAFVEAEDGTEIVTVEGKPVGTVEWMPSAESIQSTERAAT